MLPWVLSVLVLPVALYGIAVSAPTACDQLPTAFDKGVTTRQSNVAGGFIADRCETTRNADGAKRQVTVINWSGTIAAVALCLGAWLTGAVLAGRLQPRAGAIAVAASMAALVGAVVTFFA